MKSDTILRGARILIAILTTCFTTPLLAQGTNLVYINGINTTRAKALIHMFEIQSSIVNQAVPAGRKFSFDFVHNPIGFYNVKDNTEDHYELFLLKTAEECFRADYLQILSPHNQSRAIDRNAASKVNAFLDRMLPGPTGGHSCGENYLTYYKKVTDADMAGTQKAAIALADQVKKLGSAIVVAHSQGNLLAHLAYARIASSEGSDTNRMMRVVNVANTSSISVNGLDLTHEKDLALLGLKVYGINFSRSTPDCNSSLCRFTNAPATIQGVITGLADKDNHDLITTYLSAQTANLLDSQGVNLTAGQITFAGRFKDFVNAAATSLELAQTLPPSPVVSLLSDSFDGPTIDSTKWNSTGQSTISAGHLNLGVLSSINTKGKMAFTGPKLVIEFRASSSGSVPGLGIALLEIANTANRIYVQDTSYGGYGFLGVGEGAFASQQKNLGNHTANELEYRVTIDGSKMTIERGTSLSNLTLHGEINLGASIAGRSLYLDLGTNQQTSSSFDWIRVGTEPTAVTSETMNFDNNQMPAGWKYYTVAGANASIANGALQIGENTQGGIVKSILGNSYARIRVEYDVTSNIPTKVAGSIILLTNAAIANRLSPGGFTQAAYWPAGFGAAAPYNSSIIFGPPGVQTAYFDNRVVKTDANPQATAYHITQVFEKDRISQTLLDTKSGNIIDNISVAVPGFDIRTMENIWLFSISHQGTINRIDNVSITYSQ